MNILFLSSRFPYPALKGDQLIVYQRIKGLSRHFKITLVAVYTSESELKDLEYLKKYCHKIIPIKLSKARIAYNITKGLFADSLPLQVCYFDIKNFDQLLSQIIEENEIDLIHAFTLRLAEFARTKHIPVVYELIDSMQLNVENMIREEKNLKKWLYKIEGKRIGNYEKDLVQKNSHITLVSAKDKERIGLDHIHVVPNGVDMEQFIPADSARRKGQIVFSGNMNYLPNIHAVKWFVKYCFPMIRESVPNATFVIAGANPSNAVRKLHNGQTIIVTGYVDSLVDILTSSEVAIAPMRSGSGMQNKILEAMACGIPVVTTHNGLEGIFAKNNEEILVADVPELFAQSIISLMNNPDLYDKVSSNSRNYVQKHHSWEKSNRSIIDIYLEAYSEKEQFEKA